MRPPGPRRERGAALGVLSLVAAFAAAHAAIAGLTWRSLRNEWALDLAYFHHQVWNVAHGNGFAQSLHWHESQWIFGNTHFNPIIVVAAPLQWLWPGLDSLLAVQALLIALGGYGAWRLARAHGAGPEVGLGAAAVFLLQAPLWRLAQADVRPLLWCIPFLVLLAAALAERRGREALLWALLACLCREEIPVLVAALALLHGFGPGLPARRRAIALRVAVGALALLAATSVIRPEAEAYIDPTMWLMESLGWGLDLPRGVGPNPEWVQRFPARATWVLSWAWPVGLLAVAAPRLLLATVPLFAYLLTSDVGWASWSGEGPHYTAPAVAIVGAAAAVALGRMDGSGPTAQAPWTGSVRGARRGPRWLVSGALGLVLAVEIAQLALAGASWIREDVGPVLDDDQTVQAIHDLAALVPADAPVMADFDTVHLFVGRRWLYCYEREAMRADVDPASEGPLLAVPEQPTWALLKDQHTAWIARAERAGLVERGRAGRFVLLGPAHCGSGELFCLPIVAEDIVGSYRFQGPLVIRTAADIAADAACQ